MKVFSTILAIALGLWVCGIAAAAPLDMHDRNQVAPVPATLQDLPNPAQVAPASGQAQDLRHADRLAPVTVSGATMAPPPPESIEVVPPTDGGLSTLLIVLISLAGALALAAAGYATIRIGHGHGHGHGHAAT